MESHQSSKLDTSGTAKAVISCFKKLGVSFDMDQVGCEIIFVAWTQFIGKFLLIILLFSYKRHVEEHLHICCESRSFICVYID